MNDETTAPPNHPNLSLSQDAGKVWESDIMTCRSIQRFCGAHPTHHLAIMILKKQTGSMDSFHASCEGLKCQRTTFYTLFTLQISHNPHTGLQTNRRGAWFIHENNSHQSARTRTIAKFKKMLRFFRAISGFFRLISGIFRPSFSDD